MRDAALRSFSSWGLPVRGRSRTWPFLQGCSHLRQVAEAIVDAGDAAETARGVVENAFDDVRDDAELGEAGRRCAPQVVHDPVCGVGQFVEAALGAREAGIRVVAVSLRGKEALFVELWQGVANARMAYATTGDINMR